MLREVEEGQKCRLGRGREESAEGGGGGTKVLTQQKEVEEGQKC